MKRFIQKFDFFKIIHIHVKSFKRMLRNFTVDKIARRYYEKKFLAKF